MSSAGKAEQLRSLVRLFSDAAEVAISEWESQEKPPASDAGHTVPSSALHNACRTILGVSGMCADLCQEPGIRLTEIACYNFLARALHIAVQSGIPDILAEAEPQTGMSSHEISRRTGIHEQKLTRVLRTLCTFHIFLEVRDHHFANSRTSQVLVGDEYLRCWILLHGIELFTASDELLPLLLNPVKGHSTSNRETAWQEAIGSDQTVWEYLEQKVEQPDGTLVPRPSLAVWAHGMVAGGRADASCLDADYPWESLGNSTVVDVGGGAGGTSLDLSRKFPNLSFVVEDRPSTIQQAEYVWAHEYPQAIQMGRVKLVPHNFFSKQPIRGAEVYFMRYILHDWPDDECVTILSHLCDAMSPTSKLLIVDKVLNTSVGSDQLKPAPFPLPANYGVAQAFGNLHDLAMMACHNGMERTPEMLETVAQRAGLKITKIWESRSTMSITEMVRERA